MLSVFTFKTETSYCHPELFIYHKCFYANKLFRLFTHSWSPALKICCRSFIISARLMFSQCVLGTEKNHCVWMLWPHFLFFSEQGLHPAVSHYVTNLRVWQCRANVQKSVWTHDNLTERWETLECTPIKRVYTGHMLSMSGLITWTGSHLSKFVIFYFSLPFLTHHATLLQQPIIFFWPVRDAKADKALKGKRWRSRIHHESGASQEKKWITKSLSLIECISVCHLLSPLFHRSAKLTARCHTD